jgi:hypothetical protein
MLYRASVMDTSNGNNMNNQTLMADQIVTSSTSDEAILSLEGRSYDDFSQDKNENFQP